MADNINGKRKMRKIGMIMAVAACVAACSAKEDRIESFSELTVASETATRTHLESPDVIWDSGDAVNVFVPGDNNTFVSHKFATSETGSSATFKGDEVAIDGNTLVFYPYSETNTYDGAALTTSLATVSQTVVSGSYPEGLNLSVGKCGQDKKAMLRNVGALLRFKLTQEGADTLKRIEISSNDGKPIAYEGNVRISLEGGNIQLNAAEDCKASDVITLTPKDIFKTGEVYYVWVAPAVMESGLTVTLVTRNLLTAVKSGASALSVERNSIVDLGEIGGLTPKGKDVEKKTISFDFSGEAMTGWPTADKWKTGSAEKPAPGDTVVVYKHPDGNGYEFVLTDAGNATAARVYWSADKGVVLGATYRYFGFPVVKGFKLVRVACEMGTGDSSGRQAGISDRVIANNTTETYTFVAGGDPIKWTKKGDTYSYTLEGTDPEKIYYLVCTKGGVGVMNLTLEYEKVE